jgi:hypothetical protein
LTAGVVSAGAMWHLALVSGVIGLDEVDRLSLSSSVL